MLSYAVVVATRNRLEMLQACLPIFLNQTRTPSRVVIVDRSDDHDKVREFCLSLTSDIPLVVVYGAHANLPAQRNEGIDCVTDEDVIIFPDDDSLWHGDTAAKFMEVYEADVNCRYGAVSGVDIYSSPLVDKSIVPTPRTRITDNPYLMRLRNSIEMRFAPQPFEVYGLEKVTELSPVARNDALEHPLVSSIGGYRMSFRTDTARTLKFDELLGSRIGYATHEDKDMGLRVLRSGQLIAVAPEARVFHNTHPSRRAKGYAYGFFHVLNYAYVCRKIFPTDSRALAVTSRYLRYKVTLYATRVNSAYNRDIFHGARDALRTLESILESDLNCLGQTYTDICERNPLL